MASVIETEIENPDYINFLKVGLALRELQKGLGPFISDTLKTIHGSILSSVGVSNCGSCTSSNILLHSSCKKKGCFCWRNLALRRYCPSGKCDKFHDEIVQRHRFGNPQLENSDVSAWFSNPWEFGKCFMLPHSSVDKASAVECDVTALLALIINCTPFEQVVGVTIQKSQKTPKDVFTEVRDLRNSVMHSEKFALSEADMTSALDTIITVLQSGSLQQDTNAIRAVVELQKLKDKSFVVTRPHEKEVMEDRLKAIEELLSNATTDLQCDLDKLTTGVDECKEKINSCREEVKHQGQQHDRDFKKLTTGVNECKEQINSCREEVKHQGQKHDRDIKKVADAGEEVKAQLDAHCLQMQNKIERLEEDLPLKTQATKELERLIDDTEADLETHRGNVAQQNLQDNARLTNHLFQTLRMNQVLILTGISGAGKTFQALQILSIISRSCDYKPVIIRDFDDTKHVISSEEPLCILVDDIFGRYSLNKVKLAKWNQSMNTFVAQIKRKGFLLLVTLNSVREKQCRKEDVHNIIKQYSINLDDDGLTQKEKREMAQQCIDSAGDDKIKKLATENQLPLGFPLICQLSNSNADIDQLMTEPLQNTIEKMEPSCFVPLLITLLTDEQFDESCLVKPKHECMAKCFENIKKHFSSHKIDINEILEKADSMIGSYLLQKEPRMFKFIHHAVLEATFKAAIEKHLVDLLIEYCHLGILLKLTDNLQYHLTKNRMETLLKRMSTEHVPVKQLAQCTLWKDDQFQDQALQFFASKLDFFITSDKSGWSLFVAFSGLGLSLLLTKILNRTYNLETKDIENQTELALLAACSHGHLECVDLLLNQQGMAVTDEHMFRCIQSGNVGLFDNLTTKGGSTKATNERQRKNILHEACIHKKSNMVRKVISCNTTTDRNVLSNMKMTETAETPLCLAAKYCDVETVKYLIDSGSSTDVRDWSGRNILHLALIHGTESVISFIQEHYSQMIHEVTYDGGTTLQFAAQRGSLQRLQSYVELGVNPHAVTVDGINILHTSALYCRKEVVNYVLEKFHELIKQTSVKRRTAAHYAAVGGDLACLKALINQGIDPLSITSTHHTLLHIASRFKHHATVKYLCKTYPHMLQLRDKNRYNAAHFAAFGGDIDCLKTLIHHGMDPLTRTSTQQTVLHLASWYKHPETVDYLCRTYPRIIQLLDKTNCNAAHAAAMGGDIECLKSLIQHGTNPGSRNSSQQTILHLAAWYRRPRIVEYLCQTFPYAIQLTDENQYNAAHYAAFGGDLDCLKNLIDHGIDMFSRTSIQQTVLHLAAWSRHPEIVEYLCKAVTDIIQLTDENHYNAAHIAAVEGDIDCLRILINHGIDPMTRTSSQMTLLHVAAWYKHHETVEYLCRNYPHIIQLTDKHQYNAAHFAALGGELDCMKTLINYGIDSLSMTSTQRTLLYLAAQYKHREIVDYLCKTCPHVVRLTDKDQYNAAHAASMSGDIECLKTLINHGIDPLSRTSTQQTLLHLAAEYKHPDTVEYLCKAYPHIIQITDVDMYNAAHYAARSGDVECLKTLINHGIDPLSRTFTRQTLLHVAATHKHIEVVDYLCQTFTNMIQLQSKKHCNAAHAAAKGGDIECFKSLINHGIDPLSRTATQSTVLCIASRFKHPELVDYICKTYQHLVQMDGKNNCNAAHYAARSGDLDSLKNLINHGIDPLSRTSTEQTLLHVAAQYKHRETVAYLCKAYPHMIQMADADQYNAAHAAAMTGDIECLKTLLNHGIDLLSRTPTQQTLLHIAAWYKHRETVDYLCKTCPNIIHLEDVDLYTAAHYSARGGDVECLKTLVNYGIDPWSRTSKQQTVLHVAARYKHSEMVVYLCETYTHMIQLTYNGNYNAAHAAAEGGHNTCLKTLIQHDIDPLSRSFTRQTLLHVAAEGSHHGIVAHLCKTYPHMIQLSCENQYNAAHYAAQGGDINCLKTLIQNGIDPLSRTSTQETLLHIAAKYKRCETVEYLCKTCPQIIQLPDVDQYNAAHYAARGGDINCLKTVIDHGIDPLSTTSTQQTVLHLAARYKHREIVEYLCTTWPQIIKLTDNDQCDAVHHAALGGAIECVKILIQHGMDPLSRTSTQQTVLHLAAWYKHPVLIEYLCKAYPHVVQRTDKRQYNAAHYAALGGNIECLKKLINYGIDPLSRTVDQHTLLHVSAWYKHRETVEYLCKAYPGMVQLYGKNHYNAAHFAARVGAIECLKTLVNHGIDPLSRTSTNQTLLHIAARYKHLETVEYICETYPHIIQLKDENQYNAAHTAAFGGDIDCLKTLLEHGIEPMSRTSTQETLLHVATGNKHQETVEYICKTWPQMIHITDRGQYNAAHVAVLVGDIDCLKTLITHGIDPLSRTSAQQTLLHLAAENKHRDTVDYLCKAYPHIMQLTDTNQYNAAHAAAFGGDIECLKALINHGIDPLFRTSKQQTLLHIASRCKHLEAVEYICKTWPQMIHIADRDQYNAAHVAALVGDIECLKTLISHGIDPLFRTSSQQTLLQLAAKYKHPETVEYLCKAYPHMIQLTDVDLYNAAHFAAIGGDIECLKTLINHGIDPLSRTSTRQTVLHVAARHKHPESVDYLCKTFKHLKQLIDVDQFNAAHAAAIGGGIECLKTLLNHGIDPLSRASTQQTLLHIAAWYRHSETVDYLCKICPHMIQLTDKNQYNAAHIAAIGGDLHCFKTLINYGINPMTVTSTQRTLLHLAAWHQHRDTVEFICETYPLIIQLTDLDHYNAAHYAARGGDIECLKTLINHGIDPLSRTSTGRTLLHVAAFNRHSETVEYICLTFPNVVQLTDKDQFNAAHVAAMGGDTECLKTLIRHGIDPLSMTSTQQTLLHLAAWYKYRETVEYLCTTFQHMIKLTDDEQYNAAHFAAREGDIDCLETLIYHGIDPLSMTSKQRTLLHVAARYKHPATVDYLCKTYTCMIQLLDKGQSNAAHAAAMGGDIECLKSLINHGIDPLSRTSTQQTVLHIAARYKHPGTVEYLCKAFPVLIQLYDENYYNAAHYAARVGDIECLKTLINHGIDPLSRTSKHHTLLHVATLYKRCETVEYLRNTFPHMEVNNP